MELNCGRCVGQVECQGFHISLFCAAVPEGTVVTSTAAERHKVLGFQWHRKAALRAGQVANVLPSTPLLLAVLAAQCDAAGQQHGPHRSAQPSVVSRERVNDGGDGADDRAVGRQGAVERQAPRHDAGGRHLRRARSVMPYQWGGAGGNGGSCDVTSRKRARRGEVLQLARRIQGGGASRSFRQPVATFAGSGSAVGTECEMSAAPRPTEAACRLTDATATVSTAMSRAHRMSRLLRFHGEDQSTGCRDNGRQLMLMDAQQLYARREGFIEHTREWAMSGSEPTDDEWQLAASAPMMPRGWRALQFAPMAWRSDPTTVAAFARQSPQAVVHASAALRADSGFLLSIGDGGDTPGSGAYYAMLAACPVLRADSGFVQELAARNGCVLYYASANLQADRGLVLTAVSNNGLALESASETLRADRDVVLAAVRQRGTALRWASESLQASRGVVLAAVHACGEALRWASAELRADADVVTVAAADSCQALNYADVSLLSNLGFMSRMVNVSGLSLRFATAELRGNRGLVQDAVRQSGVALAYAGGGLWADRQVVLSAVAQDSRALAHSHPWLHGHATLRGIWGATALQLSWRRLCVAVAVRGHGRDPLQWVSWDLAESVGLRVTRAAAVAGYVNRFGYHGLAVGGNSGADDGSVGIVECVTVDRGEGDRSIARPYCSMEIDQVGMCRGGVAGSGVGGAAEDHTGVENGNASDSSLDASESSIEPDEYYSSGMEIDPDSDIDDDAPEHRIHCVGRLIPLAVGHVRVGDGDRDASAEGFGTDSTGLAERLRGGGARSACGRCGVGGKLFGLRCGHVCCSECLVTTQCDELRTDGGVRCPLCEEHVSMTGHGAAAGGTRSVTRPYCSRA
jgi:hypothetical protein